MLFNSYTFLVFFLIVLIVSRLIGNWTWRKLFLLIMSYMFYAAWNPPFVILLWISTLIDWFAARAIYNNKSKAIKNLGLAATLIGNLGLLAYFKYGNFFIDNINNLFAQFSIPFYQGRLSIILPVGISFYTFQTLSYTLDVYRGKFAPSRSFINYALYVTFFPQLVAGPIVRADEFLPQCENPRKGSLGQISWGMTLLVIGLFCKVVLADLFAAPIVEKVFTAKQFGFLSAWTGAAGFAMQIFYDFFGYSSCAIGAALCLGFHLPENFRSPYASIGFSDFWKRWHISLSSWLKDYLYIPLGGNRNGVHRAYLNLMLTMLLGGIWHGASWMFVIWGGIHGFCLVVERLCKKISVAKLDIWQRWYGKGFLILATFLVVCVTWVFFRAISLSQAFLVSGKMLYPANVFNFVNALVTFSISELKKLEPLWLGGNYIIILGLTAFTLITHVLLRESNLAKAYERIPRIVRVAAVTIMLYMILVSLIGNNRNEFIYFQF